MAFFLSSALANAKELYFWVTGAASIPKISLKLETWINLYNSITRMARMVAVTLVLMTMVVSSTACSIEEEITRISVREAKRSELEAKKAVEVLRNEVLEMKKDMAWYSLHVAAAAACRGSTPTGGSGPNGNMVYPKENTNSCDNLCAQTYYTVCDADVSIQGEFGKAGAYSERIGMFYNYGCSRIGNPQESFDEVKAEDSAILQGLGIGFYRFCCCRRP